MTELKANPPRWMDKPDQDGTWVCRRADGTLFVTERENGKTCGYGNSQLPKGVAFYGPIPESPKEQA